MRMRTQDLLSISHSSALPPPPPLQDASKKDGCGSSADAPDSPVVKAVRFIRERYPALLVMCDLCLCGCVNKEEMMKQEKGRGCAAGGRHVRISFPPHPPCLPSLSPTPLSAAATRTTATAAS